MGIVLNVVVLSTFLLDVLRFTNSLSAKPLPNFCPGNDECQAFYPLITFSFYLDEDVHIIPFFFGYLENIDYPKDRIILDIYVNNETNYTFDRTKWWLEQVHHLFWKLKLTADVENWRQSAFNNAHKGTSDYLFLFTGKNFFVDLKMIKKLIALGRIVSSPYLLELDSLEPVLFYGRNISSENESLSKADSLPLLINLKHPNVSSATFSMKYVSNCAGIINPVNAFLFSLSRMELTVHIDHSNFYGVHIACRSSLLGNEWKQVNSVVATIISKFGLHALSLSAFIGVQYPQPSGFKMSKVYVINLKRRTERRRKVEKLLKLFGFDYQLWEATDGKNLENEPLFNEIKLLDNYEDPYFKRPMKAGEVGCFLSHYRIWKDVILNNYSRIIVFEDDLRFSITGINRLSELIEDLDSQHFQWDFVYLGRKKLAGDNEKWVEGIRHLSTVSYSYWTIGYMLSYSGAQKLLQNNPLKKLLPVDEYIPIMFNQHPNSTWMEMFKKRDLSAFTVFPLIVHPEKYTVDIGYVSDTEDSPVITNYKF